MLAVTHDEEIFGRLHRVCHLRDGRLDTEQEGGVAK